MPDQQPTTRRQGRARGMNRRLANSLVALSSAAVLAIYGVGYARTSGESALISAPTTTIAALPTATTAPTAIPPVAGQPGRRGNGTIGSTVGSTTAPSAAPSIAPSTAPSTTSTPATAASATGQLKDGSYTGTGSSRHGSIGVMVVVQGGKIVSAEIISCGTRYPCSRIAALSGQVVARQSAAVDFVSGATDSSAAYRAAVAAALARAS